MPGSLSATIWGQKFVPESATRERRWVQACHQVSWLHRVQTLSLRFLYPKHCLSISTFIFIRIMFVWFHRETAKVDQRTTVAMWEKTKTILATNRPLLFGSSQPWWVQQASTRLWDPKPGRKTNSSWYYLQWVGNGWYGYWKTVWCPERTVWDSIECKGCLRGWTPRGLG